MEPVLFSVLIANYNNGRYLQEAIDSVLAQTYKNWEIVLVDDKSTDNSLEIYEKYKTDSRFHIYYNDVNKGCGYTKRRCAELSRGDLFGFLDPDDKIAPEAIERMVAEYANRQDCSIVYSSTYKWNDDTDELVVHDRVGAIDPNDDYLISTKKSIFHFAVIKKSFYDMTEGINPALRTGVDLDLYLKLEEVGKVYYVDIPLYYYRQNNPNSISIGKNCDEAVLWVNQSSTALNAYVRRIRTKNPLLGKNRSRYRDGMRWQMRVFKKNSGKLSLQLMRYFYWYMVGFGCSCKSLNHIRKILMER